MFKNSARLKIILSVFLLSLVYACSGGRAISEYRAVLTNDFAKSKSTDLKVKIPTGWFTALDNEKNVIDLWLIKDDHSKMLNFTIINLDETAIKESKGYPLIAAVKYSKSFKKISAKEGFEIAGDDEYFEIGTNTFGSYKYKNKSGEIARVAVFKYKDKIYELTAISTVKTDKKLTPSEDLFFIQDAVLSSIE
ncbi:MAG: hypothetical protein C0412_05125 [Flavobacterium sp.]|nr:hypothetical protein [Flavobacterium sp.]